MRRLLFRLGAVCVGTLLLPWSAFGQAPVFDSLDNSYLGSATMLTGRMTGQKFTVDGFNYTLNSATLLLSNGSVGTTLRIYGHDAGTNLPDLGLLVGTMTAPGSFSTLSEPNTWTGAIPVSAGTSYWLVLSDSNGQAAWTYSDDITGSGAWFAVGRADKLGATFVPVADSMMNLQLTATAVPEPATTAAIAGAAVLGFVAFRRRRRAG